MQRIDVRTVELTDAERAASEWFDDMLDRGRDIATAIACIQSRYPWLSHEFIDYLKS